MLSVVRCVFRVVVDDVGKGKKMASFINISKRLQGFDAPTVWSEFTPLSQQYKSVNLGRKRSNFVCTNNSIEINSYLIRPRVSGLGYS